MFKTLKEAQEYLESFIRPTVFERVKEDSHLKDPLDRMRVLLHLLGDPQKEFKSVQVSGTSGKGSTAYLLANILTKAGYKTGFATSPHLQRISERMQINMQEIPDHGLLELVHELVSVNEQMKNLPEGEPSYFELLTALAFMHFAKEKVDIAVVEVGLEGKYDATNVLDPLVVILTNISQDHTELLGDTEEAIAGEAFSIVRKNLQRTAPKVITGIQQQSLLKILDRQAKECDAEVKVQGRDFFFHITARTQTGVCFAFAKDSLIIEDLEVHLRGAYQVSNASLAISAVFALKEIGLDLSVENIRQGLLTASFPGRFEVISYKDKTIVLDGAHNNAKMNAFLQALSDYYPDQTKTFIIGFKKNKDIKPMLKNLFAQKGNSYIFTQFHKTGDYVRSSTMELDELKENVIALDNAQNYSFQDTVPHAFKEAISTPSDLLVVTGSLYLVGEMRDLLDKYITVEA
ncbi:MAG: Mur ligase family protein [Patescibacteria group bacterium]